MTDYKINSQEAYATTLYLNADFEYKGDKYRVTCTYFNGDGIEDIEVYYDDGSFIEGDITTEVYEIGKQIVQDMGIEEHLTL